MANHLTASAEPQFQPFSWLPEGDHDSAHTLLAQAMDVAYGIEAILEIVEENRLRNCNDEPGYFSDHYIGALIRFATVSARLLGDTADRELHSINTNFRKTQNH